ncbi:MAG: hypothetical protein ACI9HE_000010 [Planctomycetota bacterium]|jgi:hypothetical protein
MILRRLTKHVRQENWLALVLDLVVVSGLFLAFQLDRWYESQRTQSDLQAHLVSLREDFVENDARPTLAIGIGHQEMQAALALRAELRKESPELSVAELNQLISDTSQLPTFDVVDFAYRTLSSSGALAGLASSDLKQELAEFYAAHELTKLIQNTQELQFVTIWQPYALANLDYAATNTKSEEGRDFDVLMPYLDPDLVLKAMQTKQFENILVLQWETAEDLVNDWSNLLERVRLIQAMLPPLPPLTS